MVSADRWTVDEALAVVDHERDGYDAMSILGRPETVHWGRPEMARFLGVCMVGVRARLAAAQRRRREAMRRRLVLIDGGRT